VHNIQCMTLYLNYNLLNVNSTRTVIICYHLDNVELGSMQIATALIEAISHTNRHVDKIRRICYYYVIIVIIVLV
jgi:hypothetical protein